MQDVSAAKKHDDVWSDRVFRSIQHPPTRTPTAWHGRAMDALYQRAWRYARTREEQGRTDEAAGQKAGEMAPHTGANAAETNETQQPIAPGQRQPPPQSLRPRWHLVFQHQDGRKTRAHRRRRMKRIPRVVGRLDEGVEAVSDPSGQVEEPVPWTGLL